MHKDTKALVDALFELMRKLGIDDVLTSKKILHRLELTYDYL